MKGTIAILGCLLAAYAAPLLILDTAYSQLPQVLDSDTLYQDDDFAVFGVELQRDGSFLVGCNHGTPPWSGFYSIILRYDHDFDSLLPGFDWSAVATDDFVTDTSGNTWTVGLRQGYGWEFARRLSIDDYDNIAFDFYGRGGLFGVFPNNDGTAILTGRGNIGDEPRPLNVYRVDLNMDTLWNARAGYSNCTNERGLDVIARSAGGWMVCGAATINAREVGIITRIGPAGNVLTTHIHAIANTDVQFNKIRELTEHRFFIVGSARTVTTGNSEMHVSKASSSCLVTAWNMVPGLGGDEELLDMDVLENGDLVCVGYTETFGHGREDWLVARFDTSLCLRYLATFGGEGNDRATDVDILEDGRLLIAGHMSVGRSTPVIIQADQGGDTALSIAQVIHTGAANGVWRYALKLISGRVDTVVFTSFALGTGGSVSGEAAENWSVLENGDGNNGDSVIFVAENSVDDTARISGFALTNSSQQYDFIDWSATSVYGRVLGPHLSSDADDARPELPNELTLFAYPNPFNPTTMIAFDLPKAGRAKLVVYDLNGRLVQTLLDEQMSGGHHEFGFDGAALPSGIYFARLSAGNLVKTQKMVLLK